MKNQKPLVAILMGSDSDLPVMEEAGKILAEFKVPYEITVSSAHRSPERTAEYARRAAGRGLEVLISGAGGAAHLAGVIAAHTILPVIGVPMESALLGLDSLLSTVQMPAGVPVATVAIAGPGRAMRVCWRADPGRQAPGAEKGAPSPQSRVGGQGGRTGQKNFTAELAEGAEKEMNFGKQPKTIKGFPRTWFYLMQTEYDFPV